MNAWYRRKTWTKTDEEEFFAKLGRARQDGRAQYLKIQASELVETRKKELLNVAETLLIKILADYPDDNIERSSVLNILGTIYKLRGKYEKAIDYYRQSLDFESSFPNVITTSYLDFAELVVKTDKRELFDFAEGMLSKKLPDQLFLITKYKIYSLLSIINKANQDLDKAKAFAKLAEQNANAETSALRYHRYLGVLKERDNWLEELVKGK